MGALTPLHVFVKEFETLLNVEIDRLTDNMSHGHLENHAEYKYLAGKIAGLRAAIEYLAEADKIYKERYL
jgi:hypothetical protein